MRRLRMEYGGCSLASASLGDPLGLHDLMGSEGGASDVADLARPDQIGQGAQGLVDVHPVFGPVDLVEVDVVRAQPSEAVLALGDDPATRVPPGVGVLAHRAVDLGGQHDGIPVQGGEGLTHDLLGLTEGVDVGRVDEVDAGVHRSLDDADRVVVVLVAPRPEHHRPETERADLDSSTSKCAVVHHRSVDRFGPPRPGETASGHTRPLVIHGL
jgi:hypothetical protein